jgi:DNA invertase Pin-like site-specific DNA recombinase
MKKSKYQAAVYVRLSKEDGDLGSIKAESNSISNQKSLIMNFLKSKEDIEVVSVHEDDGYSGSNFDRPAFQKMMEEVKDGAVNCIVVKDLSRFGREYIDSGRYIERLFPALGVRFIAINDGYDSADNRDRSSEIVIPFKNLMNDAYCRDISVKIRSHLEVKRQNGEFVGSLAPYGYKKDENNHNLLVPDDFAANVVRDIYSWLKAGYSLDSISKKLNEQGVPSPQEHKLNNGLKCHSVFKKREKALWYPLTVRRIATNPVYIGMLIQGKVTTPNHKLKNRVSKNKEEWAVVENNHTPIVSERDFRLVQKVLRMDTRTDAKHDRIYTLSGFAVCADCGNILIRRSVKAKGRQYIYYMCSTNIRNKTCSPHRIREDILEDRVAALLREIIEGAIEASEVIDAAGEMENNRFDMERCQSRVRENEEELVKYDRLLVEVFEDFKEGVIDKEEFLLIKQSFEKNRKEAREAITRLQQEMQKIKDNMHRDGNWLADFKENKSMGELTRRVLVELVDRIEVYEDKNIEIFLDSEDRYRELINRAEEIEKRKVV